MADLYDEIVWRPPASSTRRTPQPLTASDRICAGLGAPSPTRPTTPRARILHLEAVGVSPWLEQHRGG
jgi:hypothetical protein